MAKKKSKKSLKNKPKVKSKKARSYAMPAVKKSRKPTGKRKVKRTKATELQTTELIAQDPPDFSPITKLLAEQTGLLGAVLDTLETMAKGIALLGERKGAKKLKAKPAPEANDDSDVDNDDDHGANDDEHEATADA